MPRLIILLAALLLLGWTFSISDTNSRSLIKHITREEALRHHAVLQCSVNWNLINANELAGKITLLPGIGTYHWSIQSESDSAKLYFNQGINLYYAFHIIESMASFKKAATFDKNNPMIYWGEALAYGPNINDLAYSATPDAFAAAQMALSLSEKADMKEKSLIKAIAVRYSADSTTSRASLNQLYADEMKKAYLQFSSDADIGALYADALMLQHPWDYWKHNGENESWTPEIIDVLKHTLTLAPQHPGANHYFIHALEASQHPEDALPNAHRLASLMPGVSHIVHMPSHIYIRTGYFADGIQVNESAIKAYQQYLKMFPEVADNAPLYLIHNLHLEAACSIMGSTYEKSKEITNRCKNSFDSAYMSLPAPLGCFSQYIYMTPVFNDVLFEKWDNIIHSKPIKPNYVYAAVLDQWARGMAFAGVKNIPAAKKSLAKMQSYFSNPDMLTVLPPFNAPISGAHVAEHILEGYIAQTLNNLPKAIEAFEMAVKAEDSIIYNEPKDWLVSARPYLGRALLLSGNKKAAQQVFEDDLNLNPGNQWSMKGLQAIGKE